MGYFFAFAVPLVFAQAVATTAVTPPPVVEAKWDPVLVHAGVQLSMQRIAEAMLYPNPFASTDPSFVLARYKDSFTMPPIFDPHAPAFEWDHDPWTINVIGHGLMGSELYLQARSCSFGWAGAWAFTAGATVAWEYVFEGNGTRPSVQDLVYTPVAGILLGEGRYRLWRALGSLESGTARNVARAIVDPFGELGRAFGSPC